MHKNPQLTENEGVPVSDAFLRTAIAPFLDRREFILRRVRRYDLFKRMLVHTHHNALKECVIERIIKPPHPNAIWGAIDVPFDGVPEPLLFMAGWHLSPSDAFLTGVGAMKEFPHISCLLLIFTNASTFESDAWILQRKSKWYRLKGWLLGGASVLVFVFLLSRIASVLVAGVATSEVLGGVGSLIAWLGFSYLYLTRR